MTIATIFHSLADRAERRHRVCSVARMRRQGAAAFARLDPRILRDIDIERGRFDV